MREVLKNNKLGGFDGWLGNEFGWSSKTAYNFINVAEKFSLVNFTNLDFGFSALYLLASPSVPDEAREAALSLAESGKKITHQVAKELVEKYKQESAVKQQTITS